MRGSLGLLCCLLSACATSESSLLKLAEVQGSYPPPFTKSDWVLTAWGFYLNRDLGIEDKKVCYKATYDVSGLKAKLQQQYNTGAEFKDSFPDLIQHTGTVDCEKRTNAASVERFVHDHDKPFSVYRTEAMSEPATAMCIYLNHVNEGYK